MKVQVKSNENSKQEKTYPWFGICTSSDSSFTDSVVLFTEFGKGIILTVGTKSTDLYSVGDIISGFNMCVFDEFNGEINLSNK